MEKHKCLYQGKTKSLYETADKAQLICTFRDNITAFNGEKSALVCGKGAVNNQINTFILRHLEQAGIETHLIKPLNETEALVKHLNMIPVECVVRNVAAGSLCQRLGFQKGQTLNPPIFEFFLKDDQLSDPMINASHIQALKLANHDEMAKMESLALLINQVLSELFEAHDLILVDYKLEFGRYQGRLILGDEFTPEGCRLWDKNTQQVLDKDRFRQDLGDVLAAYQEVARRLLGHQPENVI